MSRDFQLAWECPHVTIEEVVSLGTDRKSLDVRQPVASLGLVRVWVNSEFMVPSTGLSTTAQLYSTVSGPFDVVENEDVMTITTSQGTFTLALGVTGVQRFKAEKIAAMARAAGFDSYGWIEDVKGHLAITDTYRVGPESVAKVGGTAAALLGFGKVGTNDYQRAARGRHLYPGWRLEVREDEIVNRFPAFVSAIQTNPVFKVTYSVPKSRCLRCVGTETENDVRFAATGGAIFVDDEDLLYQASLKILLTEKGSNPFHPWYGTSITERIGSKALGSVAATLQEDVKNALEKLQAVQNAQSEYQTVSPKERLYAILNIQVLPHEQDPTTYFVDVTVQNASSEPVRLSIVYTAPEVVAVMGSNGLMLGTQRTGTTGTQLFRR